MNFTIKSPVTAISLLFVSGSLTADPLAEQLTFVPWTSGTFKSTWPGIVQRTYFYQWSPDLVTWHYAPFMAFGDGGHEYFMEASPNKLFVRLFTVDEVGATTLQQAREADFDSDGISNCFEVEEIGSDPFNSASVGIDSDNDAMPDWWETLYGLDPNDPADAATSLVADGVSNLMKYQTGRNPLVLALTDTAGALALKVHTPLE